MSATDRLEWPVGEFLATVTAEVPEWAFVEFGLGARSYIELPEQIIRPAPPPPGNYVATLALRRDRKGSRIVALRPRVGVVVPLMVPLDKMNLRGDFVGEVRNPEIVPQMDTPSTSGSVVKTDDATKLRLLILKASTLYTDETLTMLRPNFGLAVVCTWDLLAKFLADSKVGDPARYPDPNIAKRQWGGWVGGEFKNHHRTTETFVATQLLIADVDGNAHVERLARLLRRHRVIIHSTYKSTEANPRARVVFMLSKPCSDAALYRNAHAIVRAMLTSRGFVLDDGASDCSRLNFIPMHQPVYVPKFHMHDGDLLDIEGLVGSEPEPERSSEKETSNAKSEPRDGYRKAALRKAHENLASAAEGTRHDTLVREAWSLSRPELGLTIQEIEEALLPAYQHDLADGKRTIRDEFRARRRRTT